MQRKTYQWRWAKRHNLQLTEGKQKLFCNLPICKTSDMRKQWRASELPLATMEATDIKDHFSVEKTHVAWQMNKLRFLLFLSNSRS